MSWRENVAVMCKVLHLKHLSAGTHGFVIATEMYRQSFQRQNKKK